MKRQCIEPGCPNLTPRTRCPFHARVRDKARQQKRGNFYTAHGYRGRRAAQIKGTPYCERCGRETDLTADHVESWNPESELVTLCRSCNSARANRARATHQ